MLRQSKLTAALLMFVCSMGAHAQEFVRYHFKRPVEMRLDPTRLAVLALKPTFGANSVPGYAEDPRAFQLPLPRWRLLASEKADLSSDEVAKSISSLAAAAKADFISPVFLDERGDLLNPTQEPSTEWLFK